MKNDKEAIEAIVQQLNVLTETCNRIEARFTWLENHITGRIEPSINPPAEMLNKKLSDIIDYGGHAKRLANENIHTLGDLLQCTPMDLLHIRSFGRKSLTTVENELQELGLCLKGETFEQPPIKQHHARCGCSSTAHY